MRRSYRGLAASLALLPAAAALALAAPAMAHGSGSKSQPLNLSDYGVFYAGGNYVPSGDDQIRAGQIFVEYFVPAKKTQKYPVVMIHGGGQTGSNFLKTPDGRDGWAHDFIRAGYTVYVIDQPARGRSVYHPAVNGSTNGNTALRISQLFTAPELFGPSPTQSQGWPQAQFHTQWPGTGLTGDPAFDQFYASQVESAGNAEALNRDAVSALLDKIGPAIILTHSQSGPFGWLIANSRPNLVKAILAAEPSGPPFGNAPLPWSSGSPARAWGVTSEPMVYSPSITDPSELQTEIVASPDPTNLVDCKLQQQPARKLVNLLGIPVLMFTSQASYHAGYDYCTALYLEQAGVDLEYVHLQDIGLPGNGHMIMLEKNSAKVAKFMLSWLKDTFSKPHHHHNHYSHNHH